MNIRNLIFTILVSVGLFSCLGQWAYNELIQNTDEPAKSWLEGREYTQIEGFDLDSFAAGTFQTNFEKAIADKIPMRDDVLLANASLQRHVIALANLPISFPVYPSFFGSNYLCYPQYHAIIEKPSPVTPEREAKLQNVLEACGKQMERHSEMNWQFALIDRSGSSLSNPALNYVNAAANYTYYAEKIKSTLGPSCTFADLSIKNPDHYFDSFFHTDHHWQVQGAMAAYQQIMQNFDLEPIRSAEFSVAYQGPFYGSEARNGLFADESDTVYDVELASSSLTVTVDDKKKPISWLKKSLAKDYAGYEKPDRFSNVYADYFHGDPGKITIENTNGNGKTLLIIGDSFTNNVELAFAQSYSTVIELDPRHYTDSLENFFKRNKIDDSLVLCSTNTLFSDEMVNFIKVES